MPELPEVETIRRVLEPKIKGRTIERVEWCAPQTSACRLVRHLGPDGRVLSRALTGRTVQGLRRRAKYLVLALDQGPGLMIHLGMTGQLFAVPQGQRPGGAGVNLPDQHTHLRLTLSGGMRLYFRDIRKFGQLQLVSAAEEQVLFSILGPEPLSKGFTPERLSQSLTGRRSSIKSLLLNQRVVAGLGNIYADEALHRARIAPQALGAALQPAQTRELHAAIQEVLTEAIRHRGTTLSDYYDPESRKGGFQDRLRVYGHAGQPCPTCGQPILRAVVAQRGTHWCGQCQTLRSKQPAIRKQAC